MNVVKKKKTVQANDPKSTIELYKTFRVSQSAKQVNLKNLKRKFFKHHPDKMLVHNIKPKGSVFSDKDFQNFI